MFDLTHDSIAFHCPNCLVGLDTCNWSTEYGEPLDGEHEVNCPDCSHEFTIEVERLTRYRAY